MPHKLSSVQTVTASAASSGSGENAEGGSSGTARASDWRDRFRAQFSETVISTDTTYRSPDIAVTVTRNQYDTDVLDQSENGKHVKYGTKTAYTLADIYIADINCLQTVFAEDTYGVGYSEQLSSMSSRMKSVLGVNGDSYSNDRHKNNGTIIRNGTAYRTQTSTEETCILFKDGSMKIYSPDTFDPQQVIADGAWQSWVFGPSLLDDNGKAKTDFITWDYIRESHPRTAIGYYEPGHYCLLLVDGREPGYSRGMYLEEMAQLFESLGCKAAYNLDGGHCSFMTKGNKVISHPYQPEQDISDAIILCEPKET